MNTVAWLILALSLAQPAPVPPTGARSDALAKVEVNTVWTIPELRRAWVESLLAVRKPGGGLYTIDGNIVQRDLARSIKDAVAFLKSHPDRCPGFAEGWRKYDLYFSWPDAEQPRGGPSAGVAFVVAAYAAVLDLKVRSDVAFTGAVTADGKVQAIGGLALKVPACRQAGMRTLVLPAADKVDWRTLDDEMCEDLRIVAIDTADEALFEALGSDGPQRERYNRLLGYWDDFRRAKAGRRPTNCRLALDNVLDLVPNDLSARCVAQRYAGADMREAARNLFADAQKFDREGQPDEALRCARRGAAYADAPTRERWADFVTRLERANLPPDVRELLLKAEAAVSDGELAPGYRLLQAARAKLPQSPYLESLETRWHAFALVSALAAAAEQRPDDLPLQLELAGAYLTAKAPSGAALVYARLRAKDPHNLKWPLDECYAWDKAKRPDRVAAVLRAIRDRWPTEAQHAMQQYNLKLDPPTLTLTSPLVLGAGASLELNASDPGGAPRVTAQLDDRPPLVLGAGRGRLELDLGALTAGPHKLVVRAADRFENVAVREAKLEVPAFDAGPVLRELPAPTVFAPGTVQLAPGAPWTVVVGTRLVLDGGAWFAQSPLKRVDLGPTGSDAPPFRVETLAKAAGPLTLAPVATPPEGGAVKGEAAQVEVVAAPPCWLVSPAAGSRVAGSTPVIVGLAQRPVGATVSLLVDGAVWLKLPADEPARADFGQLPGGEHQLHVVVETAERRWVSPVALVDVGERQREPRPPVLVKGLPLLGATATGLLRGAAVPSPAVKPAPRAGALSWGSALPASEPGALPPRPELALRLDTGAALRAVTIGLGDTLAFADLPPRNVLGFGPQLDPGALATTVWTPRRAGTWRLTVSGQPLVLTVAARPTVVLAGVPSGSILIGPARCRIWAGADAQTVTLLDGDKPLATWPVPAPAFDLDPAALGVGYHVLRAVATLGDGARSVSSAVVVKAE